MAITVIEKPNIVNVSTIQTGKNWKGQNKIFEIKENWNTLIFKTFMFCQKPTGTYYICTRLLTPKSDKIKIYHPINSIVLKLV